MAKKVSLSPPPTPLNDGMMSEWKRWFSLLQIRVGDGPFLIQGYSRASLPDPTKWGSIVSTNPFSSLIFVYDADISAVSTPSLAYSDGTDWISVLDGNPV